MVIHPLHSLRWRLPLSYAAIGLLTGLTLGIVLLILLRTYYQQRESAFLGERAAMIGVILQPLLQEELAPAILENQMQGLAFLAQVRIQLLDPQSQLVADSGTPPLRAAFTLPMAEPLNKDAEILLLRDEFTRTIKPVNAESVITRQLMISTSSQMVGDPASTDLAYRFVFQAPAPNLFFRESLDAEADGVTARSTQQVTHRVQSTQGTLMGYVVLSEGPAYGRQIVTSAAWAVLIAGLVATGLAALVGWWVSRQLSGPILQLTEATTEMAAGHLAVRAAVTRRDEVGILAHAFNEMAQRVEEMVHTLRNFVADAAHEIYTPITALRTNLELSPPSPLLPASLEQVERLETLVKNLLLLSRLEAAPTRFQHDESQPAEAIDVMPWLGRICEPFASRAEQQEINFVVEVTNPTERPLWITGNEKELTQAIQNLLDNALKFSEAGDLIRLVVQADGHAICMGVEDTGIGVATDEISLLFQRFYRARNAAAYPGNGLGLAIVKAIVERHGGSVVAENTGQGMRFQLTLPRGNESM